MRSLIIFSSRYRKNTNKIAQCFAEKLESRMIDLKDMDSNDLIDTEHYDLIGFGSGVYRENLAPELFALAEKIGVKDKKVFVFSTSGVGMKYYNNDLIRLLESKGADSLGSFACKGSFSPAEFTDKKLFDLMGRLSEGHPDTKDLKKAERFLERVLSSL